MAGNEGSDSDRWILFGNSAYRLTVLPSGNVGIGSTNPQLKFYVNAGAAAALGFDSNFQTLPPLADGSNGFFILQGNQSGSLGEFNLINSFQHTSGANRGFHFQQMIGSGVDRSLMHLSGDGKVRFKAQSRSTAEVQATAASNDWREQQ